MALSAWLNAGLLYLGLRRSGVYQPLPGWALQWLRMLLAGAAMVVACYWLSLQTTVWNEAGVWSRVGWLSLIVAAGVVIYLSSLVVLGLRVRHLRR
jgi:putative peptidoglycan lipid II flippase